MMVSKISKIFGFFPGVLSAKTKQSIRLRDFI